MVKISNAELEVMNIVWEKKETTSSEIISELKKFDWSDNTIRTLINRLISKKAIGISHVNGKTYSYIPLIKENEYKLKESKTFLDKFYNGSLGDMLLNLVSGKEISKKELQKILNKINDL